MLITKLEIKNTKSIESKKKFEISQLIPVEYNHLIIHFNLTSPVLETL